MKFRAIGLRKKLILITTLIFFIGWSLFTLIAAGWYRSTLQNNAILEAKRIAYDVAINVTDLILINDLVGVHKLLADVLTIHSGVSYLFIINNNGRILSHTFADGFPSQLIEINDALDDRNPNVKKILSEKREHYIDVAWPLFHKKAGLLRLGYSEEPYREAISLFYLKVGFFSVFFLLFTLALSFILIRKTLRPLLTLTKFVDDIDEKNLNTNFNIDGDDEVNRLSAAFSQMMKRIQDYACRMDYTRQVLKQNNKELEKSQLQILTSFEIVKDIGMLPSLEEVCKFLIRRLQNAISCKNLILLIFSTDNNLLYACSKSNFWIIHNAEREQIESISETSSPMMFFKKKQFPVSIEEFNTSDKMALFRLMHEKTLVGLMCVECIGDCSCASNDLSMIELVLGHASGTIQRVAKHEDEIRQLKKKIESTSGFCEIVGKDHKMQLIYKLIAEVAPTDATVLIQGESGTGKELIARAIHEKSPRREKPFVVINCSAYPETLLESELFGHEKGAFTGAVQKKIGYFEHANQGTVFLDEIGDISPSAQIKLLRVLQSKTFERVGATTTISTDIRILTATNKRLVEEVKKGRFREDLFYRLNVIPINLPPLRERANDIPLLARHFLKQFSMLQGKKIQDFSPQSMRKLLNHHWPGNVRELENNIEHAVVLAKDSLIQISDFPSSIASSDNALLKNEAPTLRKQEKQHLMDILEEYRWNKKEAAKRLGISRSTLYAKLKKHHITPPE